MATPRSIGVIAAVLASVPGSQLRPFFPYGYDERQFCSPGFRSPGRTFDAGVHGEYPEYHTSADDLDFIGVDQLDESVDLLIEVVRCLEANRRYVGTSPYGEPQLGRRGLYSSTGGAIDQRSIEMAYLWVLSGSDGRDDLAQIALRAGLRLVDVCTAAERLAMSVSSSRGHDDAGHRGIRIHRALPRGSPAAHRSRACPHVASARTRRRRTGSAQGAGEPRRSSMGV